MAVIINTHELIEVAKDRGVNVDEVVGSVERLALVVAEQSGLRVVCADEPGFGGFLISFTQGRETTCPPDLQGMDPSGELC